MRRKENYYNEVEAFKYLRSDQNDQHYQNWVAFLGNFEYGYFYAEQKEYAEHAGNTSTFNILFESGVMDLGTYFESARRPLGNEVVHIWRDMLGVAKALEQLHRAKRKDGDEIKQNYG